MTPLYFSFVTLFQTSHKLNEKLLDLVKKDLQILILYCKSQVLKRILYTTATFFKRSPFK